MSEQIESTIKMVRGYWFVDGFTEVAAGGVFILLATLLLLSGNASPASFSAWFLSVAGGITLIKFGGLLVAVLALWWLKDHFTYPRTGFVRGERVTASQAFVVIRNVVLFLLAPITAVLVVCLLFLSSNRVLAAMPIWLPVALGILWALLLWLFSNWTGIRRFRALAVLTLLAGIAVGTYQWTTGSLGTLMPDRPGAWQLLLTQIIIRTLVSLALLVLACGVILVVSGVAAFLRYRKENPVPFTEEA